MNPFISEDKKVSLTFLIGSFAMLVMITLFIRGLLLGQEIAVAWLDWSLGIVGAAMGIRSFQKTAWKAADAYATVKREKSTAVEKSEPDNNHFVDVNKLLVENDHEVVLESDTDVGVEFYKPCEGRVTSHFRSEKRPSHHGIDIAKSGIVPIHAIADGKVMRSYNGGNGGETIITEHTIDGQYYLTLNGHLKERLVKDGEAITKGQVIGVMGNTGRSTGQHLHFEIHKGPWDKKRSNAINPLEYFSW